MALKIDPWSFPDPELDPPEEGQRARIVLGGGCFWCTEAVYRELEGVLAVRPGYAGGSAATADYRTVCGGATDHAEVIEVTYDPARITLGRVSRGSITSSIKPCSAAMNGLANRSLYSLICSARAAALSTARASSRL